MTLLLRYCHVSAIKNLYVKIFIHLQENHHSNYGVCLCKWSLLQFLEAGNQNIDQPNTLLTKLQLTN